MAQQADYALGKLTHQQVQKYAIRPKKTWRRQVEENVKRIGLEVEEGAYRTRWREGVRAIAEEMRCIRLPSVTREKPD